MPGRYEIDLEHVDRLNAIQTEAQMQDHLERYIYGVKDHLEFLEKHVGWPKLKELVGRPPLKKAINESRRRGGSRTALLES